VIDRQGRIRRKIIGAINRRIVDEELIPLVRQLRAEGTGGK